MPKKSDVKYHYSKKRLLIALVVLGGVLALILAGLIYYYRPDIALRSSTIVLELGKQFDISPKDILSTEDQDILSSVKIDKSSIKSRPGANYPGVGQYRIGVTYIQKRKKQLKQIKLEVKDTTAPELIIGDGIVSLVASADKPDYSQLFTAKDLSEVKITVDDKSVDYSKAGEYKIEVVATDKYHNQTTKTATIQVTKPEPAPISSPAVVTQPTYINGILVANKKHPLPPSYAPGENPAAGDAIRRIIADMQQAGLNVSNSYSGYRSYAYQAQIYQEYVATQGQASADSFSARPGYSEHQSGLEFDLRHSNGSLITSGTEAEWIAVNVHKYGFIVRYQAGKENITGYGAEPWHLRYVGNQAVQIYQSGLTLEEYLGVPGGSY